MSRWIAMHCGEETEELLARHPNAFLLLTQIAMRAKWKDCPITGMKAGQAFIGDWKQAGLGSEMTYRHAKKILADCNLATFKGTTKGTVATLTDSTVFSLSTAPSNGRDNEPASDKQRTSIGRGTTNHTDTRNTQDTQTPFALNGASSDSPHDIMWNPENEFAGISLKDRAGWGKAYPAVNIDRQLAAMSEWLKSNPAKAHKSNWRRFITTWLTKAQDRGGDIPANASPKPAALPINTDRKGKEIELPS